MHPKDISRPVGGSPCVSGVPRTVWFHGDFIDFRLTGARLKHSHYFQHALQMPGFSPRITFSDVPSNEAEVRERTGTWTHLWPDVEGLTADRWKPEARDVLFLAAGKHWRHLDQNNLDTMYIPRIHLVQAIEYSDARRRRHNRWRKAIRICVSQEIADAIAATGGANGPVLTIPNATDVSPFSPAEAGSAAAEFHKRRYPLTIVGYKRPSLAQSLSKRLDAAGIEHLLISECLDRRAFLSLLAESGAIVCIPFAREGFYLPPLEAMASGCLMVTLDCIGNRGFCRHEGNCLIAKDNVESLFETTKRVLATSIRERERMHRCARNTAVEHSLEVERARFHAVLHDIDRLWREA